MSEQGTTARSIALVGFMGAGKSTAGRRIARSLELDFIDTDELIAAEAGRSVSNFFATVGEARFREVEERLVIGALERGGVVALGGGAIESEPIREALRDHVTVWCQISEEVAWARCSGSDRPLARNREGFRGRFRARAPLYEDAADVLLPTDADVAAAAPWIAALRTEPGTSLIWARTSSAQYPAVVGTGATRLGDRSRGIVAGIRSFAVADRDALAAADALLPLGGEGEPIEIGGGEEAKTLATAERLLSELARAGVRRDDSLVAFGGGVIGDLAGFCAAVYQRGIPVIQIPTTVVAQVDSAYGGKTGVDLPEAKNYVGSFHQPAAVLADPAALGTLPREELAAGFAEVIKTALIAGGRLWGRVRAIESLDAAVVAPLIFDCARTKIEIVAADEREGGRRAVLNLGHTVAHAVEVASGYGTYRHGEAVGLGLLAALRLSGTDDLRDEVEGLLTRAGLPTELDPGVDLEAVLEATGRDKKRSAEGLGFVLIEKPGAVEHGRRIDADSLRSAVLELQTK